MVMKWAEKTLAQNPEFATTWEVEGLLAISVVRSLCERNVSYYAFPNFIVFRLSFLIVSYFFLPSLLLSSATMQIAPGQNLARR